MPINRDDVINESSVSGSQGVTCTRADLRIDPLTRNIRIDFIEPGNPQQNAYVELYNRTVRYDWLAHHLFDSVDEVQQFAIEWLWTYNNERPNMAIGGITPIQKLALAA